MIESATTRYAAVPVRRATIIACVLVAFVCAAIVGAYSIGHRDGQLVDRATVCAQFGANDLPECVGVKLP